ncbi:MAG: DUF4249 domain-containing protein [Cytophagales bacterium]|nr:DUF4249 domain-containing protein [Cytophagales bacterium]
MRKIYYLLISLVLLGCEDPIQIDLTADANLVVVQGWISNQVTNQEIVLSRTQGFNDQSGPSLIMGARVSVINNQSDQFIFQQNEDGIYRSNVEFRGVDSLFYQLEVILPDGDTIVSPFESVPRIVTIDSLIFRQDEELSDDNANLLETFNFPVSWAQDPPDIRNYYRWRIFRNDTLFSAPNDLELLDDSAINGNFFPNEFRSFRYEFGDTLTMEMQTLSEDAFDFLTLLKNQTTLLGTASGTLPATISGNLRNRTDPDQIVLGFFGCISSSSSELVLLDE